MWLRDGGAHARADHPFGRDRSVTPELQDQRSLPNARAAALAPDIREEGKEDLLKSGVLLAVLRVDNRRDGGRWIILGGPVTGRDGQVRERSRLRGQLGHGNISCARYTDVLVQHCLTMPALFSIALPPPRDWQDFEDLCCDLWRRLWADPVAQKNGRGGQPQAGVDVFGRPGGGARWEGVQCKVKGESVTLTRKEIEREVERAKLFEPGLSNFLIATTAPRD